LVEYFADYSTCIVTETGEKTMKNMNKAVLVLGISALAVNIASANNNTLGGTDNTITASSHSSAVFGYQNTINANNAIAFGENNTVNGTNSFAGGNNSKAMGRNSFAYGSHAEALVEYTYAIGSQARTSAYDTVAIGNGAYVSGVSSVAIGRTNNITGENTVVVGANNKDIKGNQSTVIGYNNKMAGDMEQTIIGANSETSGQGAMAIGTHTQTTAIDAVAVGNNIIADKPNSVAIGTNSVTDDAVAVADMTVNGKTHAVAGTNPSAVASFGSKDRAGFGGVTNYTRQLTNVAAGQVNVSSTDAVNGSQLFAVAEEVGNNGTQIAKNKQNIKDIAVGLNMLGDVVNDHEGQIATLHDTTVNHDGRITALENRQNNIGNEIHATNQRMNKLGASSAALSGLHPLDFNRNDKASYAVSYGHYRNANAVALGAFYRPNERTMFGIGASLGGETQLTMNIAFKVGKGSDYLAEAKDKDSRISKLEAMVQKLMAEIEQQKDRK
jgi:autotransporter adhesin